MTGNRRMPRSQDLEAVAGNGLLHRRVFLTGGAAFAAAVTGYTLSDTAAAQQLPDDPWSKGRGVAIQEYGTPSSFEKAVARTLSNPRGEPRTQHGRTPHHLLNGTFTPNGLHFVISHSGNPDIDPGQHRLVIHGLVKTAAGVHARRARPLSDGVAHDVPRMRRQQRAAVLERAGAGRRAGACTAWSRAPSGPASCSRRCSTRPASTRRRNG